MLACLCLYRLLYEMSCCSPGEGQLTRSLFRLSLFAIFCICVDSLIASCVQYVCDVCYIKHMSTNILLHVRFFFFFVVLLHSAWSTPPPAPYARRPPHPALADFWGLPAMATSGNDATQTPLCTFIMARPEPGFTGAAGDGGLRPPIHRYKVNFVSTGWWIIVPPE